MAGVVAELPNRLLSPSASKSTKTWSAGFSPYTFGQNRVHRARPGLRSSDIRKDSLWSADLFRLESLALHTHWVLVVIDQFVELSDLGFIEGLSMGWRRMACSGKR